MQEQSLSLSFSKVRQGLGIPKQVSLKLLTAEEVGPILSIKVRQVKELARQGKIPAIKVGRMWRFSQQQLDAWIKGDEKEQDYKEDEVNHDEVNRIVNQIISEVS